MPNLSTVNHAIDQSSSYGEFVRLFFENEDHTKHTAPFILARVAKGLQMSVNDEENNTSLRRLFELWFKSLHDGKSLEVRDRYWFQLLQDLPKCRFPIGVDPVTVAFQIAKNSPSPLWMTERYSEPIQLIAKTCRELQRLNGEEPFFLSYRKIRDLLEYNNHNEAGLIMKGLVHEGILEIVKQGGPHTQQATRYRYIGCREKPSAEPRP